MITTLLLYLLINKEVERINKKQPMEKILINPRSPYPFPK
jgi:hypothetical protein